jgi:hypothetical protein
MSYSLTEFSIDFDDLIKIRQLIAKYFPKLQVNLEYQNDPNGFGGTLILKIQVPIKIYTVEQTIVILDKFDEEYLDSGFEEKIYKQLKSSICITTGYV